MAKVTSTIFSNMSGSINGTTFRPARGGGIVAYAKPEPTNPRTDGQLFARANFSSIAINWTLLSDAQRDGWGQYAAAVGFIDGRTAYISSLTTALWAKGLPNVPLSVIQISHNPPTTLNRYGIGNFHVEPYSTVGPPPHHGITIHYLMEDVEDGFINFQWAGPFSPTRNFPVVHFPHGQGFAHEVSGVVAPGIPEFRSINLDETDIPLPGGSRIAVRLSAVSGTISPVPKVPHRNVTPQFVMVDTGL